MGDMEIDECDIMHRYKSKRKNFKFHLNFPKLKALKSRSKTEYFPGKMSGKLLKTKSKVAIEC